MGEIGVVLDVPGDEKERKTKVEMDGHHQARPGREGGYRVKSKTGQIVENRPEATIPRVQCEQMRIEEDN